MIVRPLLFFAGSLFAGSASTAQPPIAWASVTGGAWSENAWASRETPDGGCIAVGEKEVVLMADWDGLIAKFDQNGNIEWERSLGGTGTDGLTDVGCTPDGGYLLTGYSSSWDGEATGQHGFEDGWVMKLDGDGDVVWHRMLGSAHSEVFFRMIPLADNGCMLFGTNHGNGGDVNGAHSQDAADVWMVRLDQNGAIQWQRSFGGTSWEECKGACPTQDGGYLIAASASSQDGDVMVTSPNYSAWLLKVDASGTIQWQRLLGGDSSIELRGVAPMSDGAYVASGTYWDFNTLPSIEDAYVVKLDATGEVVWQSTIGGSESDNAFGIAAAGSGCVVAGVTRSNDGDVSGLHGEDDAWIVRLEDPGVPVWQMTVGGPQSDQGRGVCATADGGYLLSGTLNFQFLVTRFQSDPTGVGTMPKDRFSLFPNPAQEQVRIILNEPMDAHLVLADMTGREVLAASIKGTSRTLDVSGLARGPYFLTVRSGTITRTQSLVLE